jgi:hypothetical protein
MRDGDIRDALHRMLRGEHADEPGTRFLDEFDLCGQVRVDVAVVNGTLSGYEVKSDRDTLRRLPMQVEVYSRVLDRAWLVVGERHLAEAQQLVRQWWGVILARPAGDSVVLEPVRRGSWNDDVDALSVAMLLWRDEALAELEARGLASGVRGKPRVVLHGRLVENVPPAELRALVRQRLKTREGWRAPPERA